jgi:hypothetical protein
MAYKFSKGTRGLGDIVFEEDSDTGIDFEDNTIKLETGGSERLVVVNAGVGIGTSSPSTALHVSGTVSDDYMVTIDNAEGDSGHGLKIESYGNGTGTNLLDMVSRGNTLFQFRADGRLGIGTTTPGHLLSVAGNIGVDEYIYHNGDSNTYIRFQVDDINVQAGGKSMIKIDEGDGVIKINNGNNDIDFKIKDDNADVLFHADAGLSRVGIGTTSPTEKLDIDSNAIRIRTSQTPASATATGTAGMVCWDANYVYVCTATNTWRRAALSSW